MPENKEANRPSFDFNAALMTEVVDDSEGSVWSLWVGEANSEEGALKNGARHVCAIYLYYNIPYSMGNRSTPPLFQQ